MNSIKLISPGELAGLSRSAADSARLRSHHTLHQSYADPVQRMCIALQPGSYVRPHQHRQTDKWELLSLLSGRVLVLLFDEDGIISQRVLMAADGDALVLEIPALTTHSIVAIDGAAMLMEIKPGPYTPAADTDFAAWAPAEGHCDSGRFVDWAVQAAVADRWIP